MSPKRNARHPTKTVTIYNSAGKRDRKMAANSYEQSRNSTENWEFHFKLADIDTVKSIIKTKDINGVPLIIGAAVLNQKESLLNLLKHGYSINEADKNNVTPLAWSVKLKHLEMIQALLENSADSTIRPHNGDNLACMALGNTHWDEQSFLLLFNHLKNAGNVDVNAINKNGLSLLHLAVRREWNSVVDVLNLNEVNVNITTANGVTPLMLASYRNDFAIVTRLLNRGASVKRRNADGFTALCYALSSAISKELEPPFLVVDKLQIELAKLKIDLPSYLKDRIKLMLIPAKSRHPDQPSAEQMLSHIIIFILKNVENGFELLTEIATGKVLKEAMEKFLDDTSNLKLPLVLLNVIFKHTAFDVKVEALALTEYIDSGCFDLCAKVMRLYEDEPMLLQLAVTPIIIFSVGYPVAQKWYEVIKDEVASVLPKYELCLDLIDASPEQMKFIQERFEDFKYHVCNIQRTEVLDPDVVTPEKVTKANSKKTKRRTKALKARIAKMKNTELAERYILSKSCDGSNTTGSEQNGDVYDATSDEETLSVNAIKMAMGLLEDDPPCPLEISSSSNSRRSSREFCSRTFTIENDPGATKNEDEESWQHMIRNLPFLSTKMFKPTFDMSEFHSLQNAEHPDVDLIIKYLENLLEIIVNKYKDVWTHDKPSSSPSGSENKFDSLLSGLEGDLECIQNMEKEQLRLVHREFYNVTRNVKDAYENDRPGCVKIFKSLERFLLTHNIRGETILDSVADLEIVKVNASLPLGFEQSLTSYMDGVMAGDIEEDPDVKIEFKEALSQSQGKGTGHKQMDSQSMGDYVYLHDVDPDAASGSAHVPSPAGTTPRHARDPPNIPPLHHLHQFGHTTYSYPPAQPRLQIGDEEGAGAAGACCQDLELPDREKSSKWYSMVRSLELMDDGQTFLNGSIRLSNMEKRKSHVLSLNGNFSVLEIGLSSDNKPMAVKILSKGDPYAMLLKNQVEPLLRLKHKYILSYHTCKYENSFLIIATPLCEYNLGQYVLKMRQPQSHICKVTVIRQMLSGLMYLHNQEEPVIHGNLKPSNILIDINGTVKVAEFGIYKAKLKTKNLPESTIIWFATELYKMYKNSLPLTCTCASDIQVAGMLVHFAHNGGTHPFGRNVPDILKHLVEGNADMIISDMELYDLLSWMLMGEPSERPNIHQVLSHIFFWSRQKKWAYILICAGFGNIPINMDKLHGCLDKIAAKEKITGNCWVMTAKKQYPELIATDASDTPSGLLRFIKDVVVGNFTFVASSERDKNFCNFVLNAFPHFVLALYRMIENSEWSEHKIFLPYHSYMTS